MGHTQHTGAKGVVGAQISLATFKVGPDPFWLWSLYSDKEFNLLVDAAIAAVIDTFSTTAIL